MTHLCRDKCCCHEQYIQYQLPKVDATLQVVLGCSSSANILLVLIPLSSRPSSRTMFTHALPLQQMGNNPADTQLSLFSLCPSTLRGNHAPARGARAIIAALWQGPCWCDRSPLFSSALLMKPPSWLAILSCASFRPCTSAT